ncbi:type II toxin-antitoxin system VapC family toxin [Candidatus Babeliales bacterium]|nr:type II toxin-antitoxin system VapC family toxin [Candidatus Babeliales bacterium]
MAILLDTGFYFGLLSIKDQYHQKSQSILKDLIKNKYGKIYTSNYILDESLTLINIRTKGKRLDLLEKMKKLFLGSLAIANLLSIENSWLESIYNIQKKLSVPGDLVSFTDASNIILCKNYDIKNIVSFDEHFSGFLNVVDH